MFSKFILLKKNNNIKAILKKNFALKEKLYFKLNKFFSDKKIKKEYKINKDINIIGYPKLSAK